MVGPITITLLSVTILASISLHGNPANYFALEDNSLNSLS